MLWDYSLQAMQLCTAALYSGGHQLSISREMREKIATLVIRAPAGIAYKRFKAS